MLMSLSYRDFPGGEGEARCVGRARPENVKSIEGKRAVGLAPFDGNGPLAQAANDILFPGLRG